ncbi:hypothetical protein I3760_10G106700 [Carya illinoinensis]|nr:hypothetical protein I3760_10G106700 [Carya illinoinensis]
MHVDDAMVNCKFFPGKNNFVRDIWIHLCIIILKKKNWVYNYYIWRSAVAAIRPKTVRFKPMVNRAPPRLVSSQ